MGNFKVPGVGVGNFRVSGVGVENFRDWGLGEERRHHLVQDSRVLVYRLGVSGVGVGVWGFGFRIPGFGVGFRKCEAVPRGARI